MTTNNNGEKYWKLAKIVNTMLLCSHIYLIIMFFMFQVRLMVFVNIVSIQLLLDQAESACVLRERVH